MYCRLAVMPSKEGASKGGWFPDSSANSRAMWAERLPVRAKGVPSLRNRNVRGDHYVTLIVHTPVSLSKEAKELLQQFDQMTEDSLHKENGADASASTKKGNPFKKKK